MSVIHKRWVIDGEEFELDADKGESIVVDGNDLAERKRKLLAGADAVLALPGGVGTLDELMDVACLKQLGFVSSGLPICLVNTAGYYDGLLAQLTAGQANGLIYKDPGTIIHAEETAAKALAYAARLAAPPPVPEKACSSRDTKSVFKVVKALAMLPIILMCYTWLFYKTINLLMHFGGEVSDLDPEGQNAETLPFLTTRGTGEFFGLIALLLIACKNLK